ncbi:MAG: DUF1273 family protein [Clostridia bacterium]|nr:DUF1273 family protein [Clostridia bacterium]
MKKCSFIGHRKIDITDELKLRLESIIEKLINKGVDTFIFGSKSEFNSLCYEVVLDMQKKYPLIERVVYKLPSEYYFTSKSEKEKYDEIMQNIVKNNFKNFYYDKVISINNNYWNAYVVRNKKMIDDSDICIFYYDENYLPVKRNYRQTQSGTNIAFNYAKAKNKVIINILEN